MPEIGTSGSMSGDGKRGVGQSAPSHRARPRLYSVPSEMESVGCVGGVDPESFRRRAALPAPDAATG